MDGWQCYVLSAVFESYQGGGKVVMKGTVESRAVGILIESHLQQDSNLKACDPKSGELIF